LKLRPNLMRDFEEMLLKTRAFCAEGIEFTCIPSQGRALEMKELPTRISQLRVKQTVFVHPLPLLFFKNPLHRGGLLYPISPKWGMA
jgi:hypothetical protein